MNYPKQIACATAALLLSTGLASAAPARVETDLNVRSGEGTGYPVIATMPAGANVDVSGCGDGWCYVSDYDGFASAAYLDIAGIAYTSPGPVYAAPPPVAVLPAPVYRERHYWSGPRIIHRGIRHLRRELRQDRRQDRHEVRQERRHERRELRQDRREERHEARQERREERQDRRRN